MSSDPDQIVTLARAWVGTPYAHQASVKGVGTDCLGLIRGIWRELYGEEPEAVPGYTKDWSEPSRDEVLWRAARRHMQEKARVRPEPGDVVLFRMREGSVAKHLGVVTPHEYGLGFVHAYDGFGVLENALTRPWRRRIVSCFEFPGGAV
ncbi:MAG: peptidase [Arenibacterium sp.]